MTYDPMQQLNELLQNTNNLDGWSGLGQQAEQATEEQTRAHALQRYEAARVIAAPFMTAQGREALEKMREQLAGNPKWPVDELGLINAVGYGVFREGQASVVRWLDQCIKVAEEGPPDLSQDGQGNSQQ
jgi:hypothetical protein